jgi:hypothetical protein
MSVKLFLSWRSFAKKWWRSTHLKFSQHVVCSVRSKDSLTSDDSFFDNFISSAVPNLRLGLDQ